MSSGSYGDGLAGMEAANRGVVVDVEIRGVHAALLDPALELLELRAVRCRHDRCQTNDDDEDRRLVSSEPSLNEKKAAAAAVARSQQRGGQQRTQDAGQGEDHNKACHWGRRERARDDTDEQRATDDEAQARARREKRSDDEQRDERHRKHENRNKCGCALEEPYHDGTLACEFHRAVGGSGAT